MGSKTKLEDDMTPVYMTYGTMITPLGESEEENYNAMLQEDSGVQHIESSGFNKENWPLGKMTNLPEDNRYNHLLEKACDLLIQEHGKELFSDEKTLVIVSSTKANVKALPEDTFASTRTILKEQLELKSNIVIISNACISGVIGINTAADYVNSGKYNTVVVIGIDVLSDFIVYGFQSLYALSS